MEHPQVLGDGHAHEHRVRVGHEGESRSGALVQRRAVVEVEAAKGAAQWRQLSGHGENRGGLARSVRPEQGDKFALADLEVDIADDADLPIARHQAFELDQRRHVARPTGAVTGRGLGSA